MHNYSIISFNGQDNSKDALSGNAFSPLHCAV